MRKNSAKKSMVSKVKIPTLKFNSDWFECPKCGYKEMRKVLGDIAYAPCPECGHSPLYRVK